MKSQYNVASADEMVSLCKHILKEDAMCISVEEAKQLVVGQTIYHRFYRNSDGTSQRWKVDGKPKTWKTESEKVLVPIRRESHERGYLTKSSLNLFTTKDWRL